MEPAKNLSRPSDTNQQRQLSPALDELSDVAPTAGRNSQQISTSSKYLIQSKAQRGARIQGLCSGAVQVGFSTGKPN